MPSSPTPPADELLPWIDRIQDRRVVVWGDVVADCFLRGTTTRVSREAPALVLSHEGEELRPGGAGNAAMNAASLGGRVRVVGFIGDDEAGRAARELMQEAGIDTREMVVRDDGATPKKTRVMAGGIHTVRQQILRIDADRPWTAPADDLLEERLTDAAGEADVLLISDYGLGSVSPARYRAMVPSWTDRGLPVVLDSRLAMLDYPGVTAATPNETEVEQALRMEIAGDEEAVEGAGRELLERLRCPGLVITRGSEGMAVFRTGEPTVHLPIHGTDEIADVTGAGDTVIATLSMALAAEAELLTGARLANVAAGLVVLKHGTATVGRDELEAALRGQR